MAISTCPKCSNHSFEMVEHIPRGSKFKIMFVQCALCGAVVGTADYINTAALIQQLAEKLNIKLNT